MTPGKQTTEFWLTLGVSTTALWLAAAEKIPGTYGVVAAAVLAVVYNVLRGALKNKSGE